MKIIKNLWETQRNFIIYLLVGAGISLANIVLLYILIDIVGLSTIISGTLVVGSLFILKYFIYKWTGFTQ